SSGMQYTQRKLQRSVTEMRSLRTTRPNWSTRGPSLGQPASPGRAAASARAPGSTGAALPAAAVFRLAAAVTRWATGTPPPNVLDTHHNTPARGFEPAGGQGIPRHRPGRRTHLAQRVVRACGARRRPPRAPGPVRV